MNAKRIYFPPTTPQQRKFLFETWEANHNVTAACRAAHVGRTTFYYWKDRFDTEGYDGLLEYEKKGPEKGYGSVSQEIEGQVLHLHAQHEEWGKHRIANEITKANNWVPLISPNTVRRILEDAGMWESAEEQKKTGLKRSSGRPKPPDRRST